MSLVEIATRSIKKKQLKVINKPLSRFRRYWEDTVLNAALFIWVVYSMATALSFQSPRVRSFMHTHVTAAYLSPSVVDFPCTFAVFVVWFLHYQGATFAYL